MEIIKLDITDIIVTSDGLNDNGDSYEDSGDGMDLSGKNEKF